MAISGAVLEVTGVAPPRGERGLKYFLTPFGLVALASLPLVGSVD